MVSTIFEQLCLHILHSDNGGEFVFQCHRNYLLKIKHQATTWEAIPSTVTRPGWKPQQKSEKSFCVIEKEDQAKVWPSLLNDVTQLLNNYNARDRHLIDGKLREDSTATQEINSHLLDENKCTLKVVAYNAEGADVIQCCSVGQKSVSPAW